MVAKSKIEEQLIESLKDAVAFSKGKKKAKTVNRTLPGAAPEFTPKKIKALRKSFQATQEEFALIINVELSTIRAWEQGQRVPNKAANRLMEILQKKPETLDALVS